MWRGKFGGGKQHGGDLKEQEEMGRGPGVPKMAKGTSMCQKGHKGDAKEACRRPEGQNSVLYIWQKTAGGP